MRKTTVLSLIQSHSQGSLLFVSFSFRGLNLTDTTILSSFPPPLLPSMLDLSLSLIEHILPTLSDVSLTHCVCRRRIYQIHRKHMPAYERQKIHLTIFTRSVRTAGSYLCFYIRHQILCPLREGLFFFRKNKKNLAREFLSSTFFPPSQPCMSEYLMLRISNRA